MALESINPANGELLETFVEWSDAEVAEVVGKTQQAALVMGAPLDDRTQVGAVFVNIQTVWIK